MDRYPITIDISGPEPCCRICFGDETGEAGHLMTSPCNCSGSMALVHLTCLEKWVSTSKRERCEICHFLLDVQQSPPTFKEYLADPENRMPIMIFVLVLEITIFLIPTAIAWSLGQEAFLSLRSTDVFSYRGLELIMLLVGNICIILGYGVWCFRCYKYHLHHWNQWKKNNQKFRLITSHTNAEEFSEMKWKTSTYEEEIEATNFPGIDVDMQTASEYMEVHDDIDQSLSKLEG